MKAIKRIFSRMTLDDKLDGLINEAKFELESAEWAALQAEDTLEAAKASLAFCQNRLDFLEARRVVTLAVERSKPLEVVA